MTSRDHGGHFVISYTSHPKNTAYPHYNFQPLTDVVSDTMEHIVSQEQEHCGSIASTVSVRSINVHVHQFESAIGYCKSYTLPPYNGHNHEPLSANMMVRLSLHTQRVSHVCTSVCQGSHLVFCGNNHGVTNRVGMIVMHEGRVHN